MKKKHYKNKFKEKLKKITIEDIILIINKLLVHSYNEEAKNLKVIDNVFLYDNAIYIKFVMGYKVPFELKKVFSNCKNIKIFLGEDSITYLKIT